MVVMPRRVPHPPRLEICHTCHDQRSCKNNSNCVNFPWKQPVSLQQLRINMKFTHLFGEFAHPFLQSYLNFTFLIIHIEIYAVLLLAILVLIYTFLVCKIFGPRVRSCKIFDKFQVCLMCSMTTSSRTFYLMCSMSTSSSTSSFPSLMSSMSCK